MEAVTKFRIDLPRIVPVKSADVQAGSSCTRLIATFSAGQGNSRYLLGERLPSAKIKNNKNQKIVTGMLRAGRRVGGTRAVIKLIEASVWPGEFVLKPRLMESLVVIDGGKYRRDIESAAEVTGTDEARPPVIGEVACAI